MKKMIFFFVAIALSNLSLHSQIIKTIYVDFGPNDETNGNITESPDVNGNYWNNPIDPNTSATPLSLVDCENEATDFSINIVSGDLRTNGIKNGGLLEPEESLLGDFAIATATQDYFFSASMGTISITGLDPKKGYVFSMFNSRITDEVRITEYIYTGGNEVHDFLQSSGAALGGADYNGNNSTLAVSDTVRPDESGQILIKISLSQGSFAYLNAMKMEEINVNQKFYIDFGLDDETNGNITTSPDKNGNYWNNLVDHSETADSIFLVDSKNKTSTSYLYVVSEDLRSNGIKNGGLLEPEDSLLNDFAIETATQDYFFTASKGTLGIGGLDTNGKYIFSFLGSRTNTTTRTTKYTLTGIDEYADSLQTSGTDLGGSGYDGNTSSILVTDEITPDSDGRILLDVELSEGGFAYLNCMKIEKVADILSITPCEEKDSLSIAVMGSSVADGYYATGKEGYASMYSQILDSRASLDKGADWKFENISVSGNNTTEVLERWETDLLPLCSKYVIYGLSLGNEGIHTGGQTMFDQFKENMLLLISKARTEGIEPLVVNCYARNDYNSTDYDFVKQMNLLIHSWDVASINVLGTLDDGSCHWPEGYYNDAYHPNTEGHREFSYAFVPSLFDAINNGKEQPQKVNGTYLTIDKPNSDYSLKFIPEETVHSFTFSFDVKTSANGVIASFETGSGNSTLTIDSSTGNLKYSSSESGGIDGTTTLNDNEWHKVTLTHYYAWGNTSLYLDNVLQGSVSEQLIPHEFSLSGENSPTADYREWLFYRSGMNSDEVNALVNDSILKSSLELYSPLDGQGVLGTDTLINLAQSLNKVIKVTSGTTTIKEKSVSGINSFEIFPNPASGYANITFSIKEETFVNLSIFDITGCKIKTFYNAKLKSGGYNTQWTGNTENNNFVESGYYFCILRTVNENYSKEIVFIKR